jgi:hypothetical protein
LNDPRLQAAQQQAIAAQIGRVGGNHHLHTCNGSSCLSNLMRKRFLIH